MTELQKAKAAIRAFIREHWSDQKLAEVYAFNADGKMNNLCACNCILGVTLSSIMHQGQPWDCTERVGYTHYSHYLEAKLLNGGTKAEIAYMTLGVRGGYDWRIVQQRRLSAILRAEMRLRARRAQAAHVPEQERVSA